MAKQTFTTGQVLTAAQMTSLQQTAMGGGSTTAKTASYVLVAADAGTVVQMNSASPTTITVNTALFAAGDSVTIQNVGAGVCTVTAGTATVNTAGSLALSQYEGGQLYFNTTSAALFFDIVQTSSMTNPMTTTGDSIYSISGSTPARLPIGTTGQVLTVAGGVPSWATAAAGAPSWSLISTTSLTTGTSYSITGLSGYNQFLINLNSVTCTAIATLTFTLNNITTSSYVQTATAIITAPIEFAGSGSFTNTSLATVKSNPSTVPMSGSFILNGANNSGSKLVQVRLNGNSSTLVDNILTFRSVIFTDTAVVSSFQVSTNAGTFNAGSIAIYGSVI